MLIGAMAYRTGKMLDLYEQIAWFKEQGFPGIAFHTAPCHTGQWSGFDVRTAAKADRAKLKDAVAGFGEVSIHGEFENYDVCLSSPNELIRTASVATLRGSLELAAEIGAPVVTVHAGSTRVRGPEALTRAALRRSIRELGAMAEDHGVKIAFELVRDYDLAMEAGEGVGVTIDVGHVSFKDGAGYRDFGTIGGLIRHLGSRIIHMHIHDYDGQDDHIALGAGNIDFDDVFAGLTDIGFTGMLCLELNPDRTTPEDYPASAGFIKRILSRGVA